MRFGKLVSTLVGMAGLIAAQSASAYVQCSGKIQSIFSTDDGSVYIYWTTGGSGTITTGNPTANIAADPDAKTTIAFATSALLSDLSVTYRYADGASCTGTFQSITGLALNSI
jgi:hypothetical protein